MTHSIKKLLNRYGLKPQKGLGQNFLVDQGALLKIAQAAQIKANDTVLEIGPGLGSLTTLLAERAERVVAVELDARLVEALGDILKPYSNVEPVSYTHLTLPTNREV